MAKCTLGSVDPGYVPALPVAETPDKNTPATLREKITWYQIGKLARNKQHVESVAKWHDAVLKGWI